MKYSVAILASTIACAQLAAAVTVPAATPAHFFSSQDSSLVLAPTSGISGSQLAASAPGDGSSSDYTALALALGSGVSTQLYWPGVCVTFNGVTPGSANQTLYVDTCEPRDSTQDWTFNANGTFSNADGNCITLGRAAEGVPITLAACSDELADLQTWNPVVVSQ